MARVSGQILSRPTNVGVGSSPSLGARDNKEDIHANVRDAQPTSRADSRVQSDRVLAIDGPEAQRLVAQRLKAARIAAGYKSPKDFADRSNVNSTTYYHHENGRRAIRADVARRYAKLLRLPPGILLYGESLQAGRSVPIVGRIIGDGRITMSSGDVPLQQVVFPDPSDLTGYVVVGDDLYPAYREGDLVFHRKMVPHSERPMELRAVHGLECVVQFIDGTHLLRQVVMQANGLATLIAYHCAPMLDQHIVAAAPVEFVQRALPGGPRNVALRKDDKTADAA